MEHMIPFPRESNRVTLFATQIKIKTMCPKDESIQIRIVESFKPLRIIFFEITKIIINI